MSKKVERFFCEHTPRCKLCRKKVERFFCEHPRRRKYCQKRWKGFFASTLHHANRVEERWKGFFLRAHSTMRIVSKVERFFCEHSRIKVVLEKGGQAFLRMPSPMSSINEMNSKGGQVFWCALACINRDANREMLSCAHANGIKKYIECKARHLVRNGRRATVDPQNQAPRPQMQNGPPPHSTLNHSSEDSSNHNHI